MKIEIQDLYDGFNIKVDDKIFNFDQEDTREKMAEVMRIINPKAKVTYEVIC